MSDDDLDFDPEVSTPGWVAIDGAASTVYGDQEPKHYGTVIKWSIGGPDPLDGVSIFKSEKGRPHWHYVSYGLTELYEKESQNADISGYGFELTMRIPRHPDEEEPPIWVISFMQNLARYVFESGNVFESGHYLDANGPINLEVETEMTSIVFTIDPELPAIDSKNGKFGFLQIVGITRDELTAIKRWNSVSIVEFLARGNQYLITDLHRPSIMKQPDVVAAVDAGMKRDGSSTGMLFVTGLDWKLQKKDCILTFGSLIAPELRHMIPARLGHQRPLYLIGEGTSVAIMPGDKTEWYEEENGLRLNLTADDTNRFVEKMGSTPGRYEVLPNLRVEVVHQEIKDAVER